MRPETEARIIVGFLISLIAFGCGSGLGIAIGLSNGTVMDIAVNNSSSNDNPQLVPSNTNTLPMTGIKDRGMDAARGDGEVNVVNEQGSANNTTY
ncbi:hypothetical protein [Methanothermobacter wolfeii]|uniref:hypothetical protein n=1 Tax=Methanothermobacter wolfeii TaxID=145261 RepID=UPI0024B396ED|nr:hypothetical protein [Methanothermobacter wolfeii]MDI6702500.1 hypothetical protein [Methanothermobacter wolfeii]